MRKLFRKVVIQPPLSPDQTSLFRSNKKDRILSLRAKSVPIHSVVDVGVLTKTEDLIAALPDKRHYLFEPNATWHAEIEKEYASIDHVLFPVALGDKAGLAWLISTSIYENGIATHAKISEEAIQPDGLKTVGCTPIQIKRLDSYRDQFGKDYLLKIDVDGKEADILRGSSDCIRNASVVIVEADYSSVIERGKLLEDYGFVLIDFVDRVMYGELLWQCDLVYLRNDLINESLRPPMFDQRFWHPLP